MYAEVDRRTLEPVANRQNDYLMDREKQEGKITFDLPLGKQKITTALLPSGEELIFRIRQS